MQKHDATKITIFSDGACSGNPGPGGWGAIVAYVSGHVAGSGIPWVQEFGGTEGRTTNNRMEILAALRALEFVQGAPKTKKITVHTDSQYLINGITKWIFGWQKNGWKTGDGKDVTNRDLWEALGKVVAKMKSKPEWTYVPGHAGVPGNDRCDEIAVAFSLGDPVSLYNGARAEYGIDLEQEADADRVAAKKKSGGSKAKKGGYYLSFVHGKVYRDQDWKTCEGRVKGVRGAKFKKVANEGEEAMVLETWGV